MGKRTVGVKVNADNTEIYVFPYKPRSNSKRLLLGTGRMPYPVGGAIGVTLCHCRERGYTRFDIILLNIHKAISLPGCCTLTSTADFCCLARHPANCSTALPKVFSRDLQVC